MMGVNNNVVMNQTLRLCLAGYKTPIAQVLWSTLKENIIIKHSYFPITDCFSASYLNNYIFNYFVKICV